MKIVCMYLSHLPTCPPAFFSPAHLLTCLPASSVTHDWVWCWLSPVTPDNGYNRVTLSANGHKKAIYIHTLVALAFLGNPPGIVGTRKTEWQVNHIYGNKKNNHSENLEWVQPAANLRHALETGLAPSGEKHTSAKLTEAQVREIHKLLASDMTCKEIAAIFNVCCGTIEAIGRKQSWKHISENLDYKRCRALGEKTGNAKLTNEQVQQIKQLLKAGCAQRKIAQDFDVSISTIQRIARGNSWVSVT